ncbi:hypothetical protein B7R54_02685 [Subtercola boreus]|uniref:DUF4190 domain-containing protein n=1 Tax=Subtercola boreus TaxID=120213 RepID=A0A3E0VET9_9MICO|nr:DUF4190 domain-containing protein [Subtercola boreus]RFA08251.1 hypothetical protein B7R54_02685 [Subtercola boreus]TQL54856.1 uncharacterized protein DUF4190 [Subtercola boreus]
MSNVPPPPPPPAGDVPPYAAPGAGSAPGPGYPTPAGPDKYNVLAIVSLVTAFFVSLVAVITGHIALRQIKRTQEKGRGLAIAGLILGYAGILAGIITIIALIVIFAFAGNKIATDPDFGSGSGFDSTIEPFPSATSDPGASGSQTTAEACDLLYSAVSDDAQNLSQNLSELQTDPAAAVTALQKLSTDFDTGLAQIEDPDVYAAGDQANTSLKIMISDIQALVADPSAGNSTILDDAQAVQEDFSAIDTVCG